METIRYRNSIGFRTTVNPWGVCGSVNILQSTGEKFFLVSPQLTTYVPMEEPDERVNCDTTYDDSFTAMLKIAKCLPFPAVGSTVVRTFSPIYNPDIACGGTLPNPNTLILEQP